MNTNELHELAKKIAPLIGYEYPTERGWPGNFDNDGTLRDGWSRLVRKENGEIVVAITIDPVEYGHSKGRIDINVSWPCASAKDGYQRYYISGSQRNDRKASISVSGDKSLEKIAKDIKSRLLSDAESLYQEATAVMNKELDYKAKKKAAVDAIAKLTGHKADARDYERTPYFYPNKNYNVKVTVNTSNSFKVEIEVDSIDKVEKLLEFASRGITEKST